MFERAILRIGAVCLGVGLITVVVFEALHPAREDPNNNPLVFAEYAADADWTTVHLGALAGALLLIGGLVALCGALGRGPATSAAWARLATAAAVTAAAAYGVLQVVDGVALKRAVDAWAAAPSGEKSAAFAAAEIVRWTEYGLNGLTFSLVGLTLVLTGVAVLLGDRFPRLLGAWAVAAGLAYGVKGLGVAYDGFAASLPGLVALVLFGTWIITMVVLMWRRSTRAVADTARGVRAAPPGTVDGPIRIYQAGLGQSRDRELPLRGPFDRRPGGDIVKDCSPRGNDAVPWTSTGVGALCDGRCGDRRRARPWRECATSS